MILIEGKLPSWGRAQTVLQILDDGDVDLSITIEDILQAVRAYGHKQQALDYLTKECQICLNNCPIHRVSLVVANLFHVNFISSYKLYILHMTKLYGYDGMTMV